jgi:predicted RNase H-like nuclease
VIIGVDGCRGGWLVVSDHGDGTTEVAVHRTFGDVLALGAALVAVDIPIGLPAVGPRACDVTARRRLGRRGSSVFPAPVRAVLGAADHTEALVRSRAASGRGLSVQAWNLVPKIVEVDERVAPGDAVAEVHPELSFATLGGGPLGSRKRELAGRVERLGLLEGDFPDVAERLAGRPPGCAADDVLDAYATLWTARRITAGRAESLGDGERDERGLVMSITV